MVVSVVHVVSGMVVVMMDDSGNGSGVGRIFNPNFWCSGLNVFSFI